MIQVVAAILERDGCVLIGQRRPEQSYPLQWEFPGGKVEPGETPAQALTRELEEELAIRGARGEEILRYDYEYPGTDPITLIFFRVVSFEGDVRNLIYHEMLWVLRERLGAFDFLAGDRGFIDWFCASG